MNETDTPRFAALIRARLDEIAQQNRLGHDALAVVQLDQQAVGRLSRMDALQNQAMAKAQQARRDGESKGLRAALARIDAGEFGYCEDCGEPIAPKRLELNPAVTRCVGCASS
ncbi:TraR/DksA family transcriptional regulator [Antarcticimicrobium sediminis]|uniref:TraR/DksA family transcriptional regulator n=1 Tax=Antarcticimicrobium sediminis TaxID=2546227 RepID=A0A4R5EZ04_9RHOB|nr:TraR/DksA C4-type zinc finger protein [Antarcticimicrobium sediminis]TDE40329.1 TraR/DksA family transcriptional regulator [Antarcticimicrobium sediminis]